MRFDIFTLFPNMFANPFGDGIINRAQEAGLISIALHNIRDYTTDKHHITDDTPYGGGGGMVLKPDPIFRAVETVLEIDAAENLTAPAPLPIILLSPQGRVFNQHIARELAHYSRLGLICGRYEGVDERVRQYLATDEISIGDYVLTGGEVPAMVIVETVARLIPGVLGDPGATFEDSHTAHLLEYPCYTRPAEFRGHSVPDVLLSGNHAEIAKWRHRESLRRTWERRPDLLELAELSAADRDFLASLEADDG